MSQKRESIKKRKSSKRVRDSIQNIQRNVIYVTILIGILIGMVLWRYSTISKYEFENQELAQREEKLETIKNDLETKIEEINDSDWLKTQAEERINMRDPEKDQLITLDLSPKVKENRILRFFKELLK